MLAWHCVLLWYGKLFGGKAMAVAIEVPQGSRFPFHGP